LKSYLKSQEISYTDESVKKYLYNLKKEKQIFSAGRGWYSTIKTSFVLNTQPVKELANCIQQEFPLLSFSCWSTEQLVSYFHHLPTYFVTFVYAEPDSLPSIRDYLRQKFNNVYLNPTKRDISSNFYLTEKTLILRPAISEEPQKEYYATIEKILVDLYLEKDRLDLMDSWEYHKLLHNIIDNFRINIARLLRYANRREVKNQIKELIH